MSSWGYIAISFPGCNDAAFDKIMEVVGVVPTENSVDEWDPDRIIMAYIEATGNCRSTGTSCSVSTREHMCDRERHILECSGHYGGAPLELVDMLYELFGVTVVMRWWAPSEDACEPMHCYMCSNYAEVDVTTPPAEYEYAQGLIHFYKE